MLVWEVRSDTWKFLRPCGRRHRRTCVPCAGTGEPARDGKESGKEAGETRTEISEALQAVKLGIVVRARENRAHGEGPEGEGREMVQRYPTNAQADHGERSVELAKTFRGVGEMEVSC